MPDRCKLQLVQRDVRRIEVDGRDSDWRRGQIAQNIAATGRNRDRCSPPLRDKASRSTSGSSQICGYAEPRKGEREQPLQDALLGNRLVAVDCLPQSFVLASTPLLRPIAVRDRLPDRCHFSCLTMRFTAEWPWALPNFRQKY